MRTAVKAILPPMAAASFQCNIILPTKIDDFSVTIFDPVFN
jgi:hypothetical protein